MLNCCITYYTTQNLSYFNAEIFIRLKEINVLSLKYNGEK